jgi:hypothetical protein
MFLKYDAAIGINFSLHYQQKFLIKKVSPGPTKGSVYSSCFLYKM